MRPTKIKLEKLITYTIFLLASCFFLFATIGYPVSAIPAFIHDDGLFYRGMESILNGNWLGDYDNRTLVKGPFISIFAAFGNSIGIGEKSFEALFYLAASILVSWTVYRCGGGKVPANLTYVLLLSNPYFWTSSGRRLSRDGIYSTLVLSALALTILAILEPPKSRKSWLYALAAGCAAGGAFMSREEDIWLVAIVGVAAAIAGVRSLTLYKLNDLYQRASTILCLGAAFSTGVILLVTPVLLANKAAYDRAIISETRAPEFVNAIGSLMRVGNIHSSGYVPVSKVAMNQIFEAVPQAAPLRDSWPNISAGWAAIGSSNIPDYPEEIAGGFFMWALRDAVAHAGYYRSAKAAQAYYASLAQGVHDACNDGRLTCRARRDTHRPELTSERVGKLLKATWKAFSHTMRLKTEPLKLPVSDGSTEELARWSQTIGPVIKGQSENVRITGWIARVGDGLNFETSSGTEDRSVSIVKQVFSEAPDVLENFSSRVFSSIKAKRFSISVSCPDAPCNVMFSSGEQALSLIDLRHSAVGEMTLPPPFFGYLDEVSVMDDNQIVEPRWESQRMAVVGVATAISKVVVPLLCIFAVLGLALSLFMDRFTGKSAWPITLAIACFVAVLGRSAIIGYIDITSWRAINSGYLGPAYPFAIIFSVVGASIFYRSLGQIFRRN